MTLTELVADIRVRVAQFPSPQVAADTWEISLTYLQDVLHGRRTPGPKILAALGLERIDAYRVKNWDTKRRA